MHEDLLKAMKPCIFCGEQPVIEFVMVDEPVTNFDKYYTIYCPKCRGEGVKLCHRVSRLTDEKEHERARKRLMEKWNDKMTR